MKIFFFLAVPILCASRFHPASTLGAPASEGWRDLLQRSSHQELGWAFSVLLSAAALGLKMKVQTQNTDPSMRLLS